MPRRPTIPMLHPRIGASIALVPLTLGVEIALFGLYVYESARSGNFLPIGQFSLIYLIPIAPVVIIYCGSMLIWAPTVEWTRRRALRTIGVSAALACVVLFAMLGCGWVGVGPGVDTLLTLGIGLVSTAIALFLVNRLWWTPPHQRPTDAKVGCPNCAYDLQGQHECRCPECGQRFTVGQLVAAAYSHRVHQP